MTKRSEKGVALLFAMGILSLMTVLALSFASISLEQQAASKDISFTATAENLATSILDRVKYQLSDVEYQENLKKDNIDFEKYLFSMTPASSGTTSFGEYNYDYDHIWRLTSRALTLNNAMYSMETLDYKATLTYTNPTWQYILNDDPNKSNEKTLLARFAYIAVPSKGIVDLSSMFLDNNKTILYDPENTDFKFKRRGIRLAGELDPAQITVNYTTLFKASDLKNSLSKNSRFTDYSELDKYIISASKNWENLKAFTTFYTTDTTKYPEAFSLDNDGTAYHRISLPKLSQQVSSVSNEDTRNTIVEKLVTRDDDPNPRNTGFKNTWGAETTTQISNDPLHYPQIPWFTRFSNTTKAKQIAANLIDFFTPLFKDGTAYYPTSDVVHTNWLTNTPTYMGLKKSPYICGFGLNVGLEITADTTDNKLSVDALTMEIFPELISIYSDITQITDNNVKLDARGDILLHFSVNGIKKTLKASISELADKEANMRVSTGRQLYSMKASITTEKAEWTDFFDSATSATQQDLKLDSIEFSNLKIQLEWKPEAGADYIAVDLTNISRSNKITGTDADIAIISKTTDASGKTTLSATPESLYVLTATRAEDPRANLDAATWGTSFTYQKNPSGTASLHDLFNNLLASNPYYSPYTETAGTASNTIELSDLKAYLRGKYIADNDFSADELAWIHRGEPDKYLNFSTRPINEYPYPPTNANTLARNYDDGDLALLDQLKITDDTEVYGKISLNLLNAENCMIIDDLLKKVYRDTPQEATAPAEDNLQDSGITVDKNIFTTALSTPYIRFQRRSDVTKLFASSVDKEKLRKVLPMLIFLLDAEPTYLPRKMYVFGLAEILEESDKPLTQNWGATDKEKFNAGYRTSSTADGVDVTDYRAPQAVTPTWQKYNNIVDEIIAEKQVLGVIEREYTLKPYSTSNRPVWKNAKVIYGE